MGVRSYGASGAEREAGGGGICFFRFIVSDSWGEVATLSGDYPLEVS